MSDNPENHRYDPSALEAELTTLAARLGELRYIDAALAYIDANSQAPVPGPGAAYSTIAIHLGQTYPFRKNLGRHELREEDRTRIANDLDQLAEEAGRWGSNEVATLSYLTTHLTHVDPRSYDPVIDGILRVSDDLGTIGNDLGEIGARLGSWNGAQASEFATFHSRHRDVTRHQRYFAAKLADGFVASQTITRLSQHSLMTVLVAARKATEEQLLLRSEGAGGLTTKQALMVVSAFAAVAAAMTFTIPPLALGLAGASAAAGAASSVMSEEELEDQLRKRPSVDYGVESLPTEVGEVHAISGGSAEELSASLFEAVRKVSDHTSTLYQGLDDELTNLDAGATGVHDERLLIHESPSIVHGVDPDDFWHDSAG